MPSLQARASMHRFHPLMFFSKLISFSMFGLLLFAGWVGVCYLKQERDTPHNGMKSLQVSNPSPSSTNLGLTQVNAATTETGEEQKLESKLVYSCSTDKEYYHTSKHLSSHCARNAFSETAAIERGLKRCPSCLPQ
jgi:hypothetical protein